jgi:hypothetical protein
MNAPMLRPFDQLRRSTIGAADGDIGQIADAYFDDASWTIRYLVVDTGHWLPARHVLLSPCAVVVIEAAAERIVMNLTKQQIREAPGVDAARPVSRQQETTLATYYGHPYYWAGPYRWGLTPYPAPPSPPSGIAANAPAERADDAHLRSVREVLGYGIAATDGGLGHVEDMLVDEASWAIRYFIVDPRTWWPGPHVMIPTDWLTGISWSDQVARVDVTREAVQNAPEYIAPDDAPPAEVARGISRDHERRLYGHYGRPGYWERDPEIWGHRPAA